MNQNDNVETGARDAGGRKLTTADLAAAGRRPVPATDDAELGQRPDEHADESDERAAAAGTEKLDPLFAPDLADKYRTRWIGVQSSFVDDPREAVRQGDELVAQVMKSLAESFAAERQKLETELGQTGEASTENLRLALRRYRSFFERLLSL